MEKRNIIQQDVKWMSADNFNATSSNYHGYYGRKRKDYLGFFNQGNSALCNKKKGISEDGEGFIPISGVEDNGLKRNKVCQRCLKIYDKLSK